MDSVETWTRIKGLAVAGLCRFCFRTLRRRSWCWRSNVTEKLECDGCRKEAWRVEHHLAEAAQKKIAAIVAGASIGTWEVVTRTLRSTKGCRS